MGKADLVEVDFTDAGARKTPKVGWLVGLAEDGSPRIDFEGNRGGPIPARTTVEVDAAAVQRQAEVVLVFEDDRADKPIIMGLLRQPTARKSVELEVDQRRVEVEANDELVLRCGKASITLRRNGRVEIRGARVETRASEVNRIKGGSVQIN